MWWLSAVVVALCTATLIEGSVPIKADKYYVLQTAKQALSAHKVCTPDEALCVKQDRVVAILMVKNRSTDATVVENFGKIGRYFPKGSLSFFVTDAQEVIDAYAHLTGGLGPTIIVITPYKQDGTKKQGNPLLYMLPRKVSVAMNHQVTEWLIRRTLAHVERLPGDGSASTKARELLFQACNWPKMTLFSAERKVPDEVFDAIEERIDRLAVQWYHVKKKSELVRGFKEKDFDPTWDKLQHGFLMVMLTDPRTGASFRYATQLEKLPGVLDQFYVDIRDQVSKGPKASINGVQIKNMGDEMKQKEEDDAKVARQRKRDYRAKKKRDRAERRKEKEAEKAEKKKAKEEKKRKKEAVKKAKAQAAAAAAAAQSSGTVDADAGKNKDATDPEDGAEERHDEL